MQTVAAGLALFWMACSAPTGAAQGRASPPVPPVAASQPKSDQAVTALDASDAQRRECTAAERAFRETLEVAAAGCKSNDDCDLFETCHAVVATTTPALWKLRDRARDACRAVRDTEVVLSCASRARCADGRCVTR